MSFNGINLDYRIRKNKCHKTHMFKCRGHKDGTWEYKEVPCKVWSCERCGKRIMEPRLTAAIAKALSTHSLDQLVTLTLPGSEIHDIEKACEKLMSAWSRMRYQYKRKFGLPMSAIWIKEISKGRPHLHVFTKDMQVTWLRREWHKRTGAQQVDLSNIDPKTHERVSGYATKDICENAIKYDQKLGRWYGTSQDIKLGLNVKKVKPKDDDMPEWELCRRPKLLGMDKTRLIVKRTEPRVPWPTHFLILPETAELNSEKECLFGARQAKLA